MSLKTKQYVIENGIHALIYRSHVYIDKRDEGEPSFMGGMGRAFKDGFLGNDVDGYIYTDADWNRLKAAGYKEYPEPGRQVNVSNHVAAKPISVTGDIVATDDVRTGNFDDADEVAFRRLLASDFSHMTEAECEAKLKPIIDKALSNINLLDDGMLADESDDKLYMYYSGACIEKKNWSRLMGVVPNSAKFMGKALDCYEVDLNFYTSCRTYVDYLLEGSPYNSCPELTLKGGETVFYKQENVTFYETVSSTNDSEKYVSTGSFYATNCRYIFRGPSGLLDFPYKKLSSCSSNWLSSSKNGKISLTQDGRARRKIFCVGDSLGPAIFYNYFVSADFKQAVDGYLRSPSAATRGKVLGYIFRKAKPSLDAEMLSLQKAMEEANRPPASSGCCVPLIAFIGVIVWAAKICLA